MEAQPAVQQLTEEIGRGGEGVVLACTVDGQAAVLKTYRQFTNCANEAASLRLLHTLGTHPHIIEAPLQLTQKKLVYPRYPRDLYSYLEGRASAGMAPEPGAAREILAALVLAVARMHAVGIMHLDLKHENVLLRNDDTPALADFGFAKCARTNHGITPAPKRSAGSRSTSASSAAAAEENPLAPGLTSLPDAAYAVRKESIARGSFSPPEYWRRDAPRLLDGRKADAYALGVLASFCLTFQGVGLQLDKGCTVAPPFPPGTPELAVDFVRACLVFEAAERPMPQDLLEHPWIADSVRRLRSAPPPPPAQSLQWWVPQPVESEASTPGAVSPDTESAVPDVVLSAAEGGPTPSAQATEGTAAEIVQGAPDTPAADGQAQTPATPPAPPAGKTDTEVRPVTPAPLSGTEEQGTSQAGDIALLTDTIPCPQRPVRSHSHVISPSGKRTRSAAWLASPSAKRRLFSSTNLGDALVLDPLDSLGGGSALRAPEQASDSAFCSLTPMRLAHMQRTWSADGNPTPIESSPGTDPAAATQ